MRKHSPTRRAVIAGVAAAPAFVPAMTTASASPDVELLELGKQFQAIVQGLEDCAWSDDLLLARLDDVESKILRCHARTMEGLFVKAGAACWALLGDLESPSKSTTDVRMSLSIVRDLVRCFDPALERPGALGRLRAEIDSGSMPRSDGPRTRPG